MSIFDDIDINSKEYRDTSNRMCIAVIIDEGIKAKGWSKKKFAKEMGIYPSMVSVWLSGTRNFTITTLSEIEVCLGITIFQQIVHSPNVVRLADNLELTREILTN